MTEAYAAALLDLAREYQRLEEFEQQSGELAGLFEANPEYVLLLQHPSLEAAQKKEYLDTLLEGFDPVLISFLKILLEDHQIVRAAAILRAFEQMALEEQGIEVFTVTSAVELNPNQKERLEAGLARRSGKKIQTRYLLDPALIGGLRIESQDQILDQSVLSRLEKIKNLIV